MIFFFLMYTRVCEIVQLSEGNKINIPLKGFIKDTNGLLCSWNSAKHFLEKLAIRVYKSFHSNYNLTDKWLQPYDLIIAAQEILSIPRNDPPIVIDKKAW